MIISRRAFVGGAASAVMLASQVRAAPVSQIDNFIDGFARANDFSGSVSLARAGRITHQHLFGLADRERSLPIKEATTFRIGSVSKWFTAVATLRLVERGRMSLAAPMRTYLPSLTGPYGAVPLEHLLSNDSGIPDRVTQAIKDDPSLRDSTAGSAAMVARFGDGPLAFPTGEKFDYSFFNWVLIHAALEHVTGKSFEEVIAREVFRPLGLQRSGFVDTADGDIPGLASAYSPAGERKEARVPPFGGASGNIHASAEDLVRTAHFVLETNRLLSPPMRAQLLRVRVPQQSYALGGRVRLIADRPVAWETGKVQGYRTHLAHIVGRDTAVLVFNNGDMDQDVIGTFVEKLLALS